MSKFIKTFHTGNHYHAKKPIWTYRISRYGAKPGLERRRPRFSLSVYNRSADKTNEFLAGEAKGKSITAAYTLREFVDSLERPRIIQIMVKAGIAVDEVINQLKPLLDKGRHRYRRRQLVFPRHRAAGKGIRSSRPALYRHGCFGRRRGRAARPKPHARRHARGIRLY